MFLWRLGCNMFRIIGDTDRRRADFAKLVALKFFRPALSVCRQPLLSLSPTKIVNYTNMFRIIGPAGRCIADFARAVAPRSFIVRCCGPWFAQVVESRRPQPATREAGDSGTASRGAGCGRRLPRTCANHCSQVAHKNTDLRTLSFQNRLSINLLNSHHAPKSASLVRSGSIRFQKNGFL